MTTLNFPSSPTVGQVYQNYSWNGTAWDPINSSFTFPTITVNTTTASSGGSLSYNANGNSAVFTFAPASIPTYTVSTASANSTGALSLSGNTFTFTPKADQTTVTGNAGTATKLQTARNINSVLFDGSADITVSSIVNGSYSLSVASNGIVTLPSNQINTGTNSVAIWSSNQASVVWRVSGPGSAGQPLQSVVNAQSGNVTIGTATGILGGATTTYSWVFDTSGNLTFPDTTIQTTAYTATAVKSLFSITSNTATAGTADSLSYSNGVFTFTPYGLPLATSGVLGGVKVDGTSITASSGVITANAGSLAGTTLKSTVVSSSLTSVGTLTSLAVTTSAIGNSLNVTYTPPSTTGQAIFATGKDTVGGTGYFDFLRATNTTSGVTNGTKTFRLDSVGTLQILNSAYNATVFSVTDAGFIAINASSSATNGIPINNGIAMNSNSYIFDDGNYHITSKTGSVWINANDGSAVNINTQMPSGITGGGLNVQGAVKSYGAGAAATAFISSGAGVVSGVALQLDSGTAGTAANMAIRDTSTVASTMYFDVSTGSTPNGTFKFRSSSSFNELLVLSNSAVTVNKQMLIGGGSQTAYVSINGTNSYNISGSYGYLGGGGAGSIGSGGNTGTVGFSLYCSGRIQSGEVDVPSDERLKDIQGTIPLDKALQFVRAINGILYTWKPGFGDEGLKSGFSAQSVHKAGFDHMVVPAPNDRLEESTDADGFTSPDKFQLTLNYIEAIPYHHEVIKHLLDRIEQLEATVAKLAK